MVAELPDDVLFQRTLALDFDQQEQHLFVFTLYLPSCSDNGEYSCEYSVTGLQGTRGSRHASGADPIEALQKALDSLTIIANCLPSTYQVTDAAFSGVHGRGLHFRVLPALQLGMSLYHGAKFAEALPFLIEYAELGVAELQLAVGSLLFLWKSSDPATAQVAFHWCERAAKQGVGQAYQYLADICGRFPDNFEEVKTKRESYLACAHRLGFVSPGREPDR